MKKANRPINLDQLPPRELARDLRAQAQELVEAADELEVAKERHEERGSLVHDLRQRIELMSSACASFILRSNHWALSMPSVFAILEQSDFTMHGRTLAEIIREKAQCALNYQT